MGALKNVHSLLAKRGVTFSNAMVNVSLCCPSRVTTLRGQYAHNTGVESNGGANGGFEKAYASGIENSTIATWLRGAGYRTGLFGKYLNGYPRTAKNQYVPPGWDDWWSPISGDPYGEFNYTLNENGRLVHYGHKPKDYGTDVYVHETQRFISSAAKARTPFFAYLSVFAPHLPATPAPRDANRDAPAAPRTPAFNEKDISDKPAWIQARRHFGAPAEHRLDKAFEQRQRSLKAVDDGVAAIMATLRREGQLNNTYVIFTSDNGFHFGQHRLVLGKGTPYDEDVRVPLIVSGPHVAHGIVSHRLIGNIDYAPTIAELTGTQAPNWVDGRSFVSALGGPGPARDQPRQVFLIDHWREIYSPVKATGGVFEAPDERHSGAGISDRSPEWHGLRTAGLKYIEYATGEVEIYDLKHDPNELHNRARLEAPSTRRFLHSLLMQLEHCQAAQCRALEQVSLSSH